MMLTRLGTIILERSMKLIRLNIQLDLLQPIRTRLPFTPATLRHADRVQSLGVWVRETVCFRSDQHSQISFGAPVTERMDFLSQRKNHKVINEPSCHIVSDLSSS